MQKGQATRQTILDQALAICGRLGLDGLTIGGLADQLGLSKSGLFAHFKSKENLQLEIIAAARDRFVNQVVAPALKAPRGEPRVRALVEHWMTWGEQDGGCLFVALTVELDDQDGAARDAVTAAQVDWLDALATAATIAVSEGHFRKNLDAKQFAFELHSIMLGHHYLLRFIRDPEARRRTLSAVDRLLAYSRAAAPAAARKHAVSPRRRRTRAT